MCLYNFCGITGSGDNCDENIGVDNCVRSESVFIVNTYYRSCLACNSSYYRVAEEITVEDTTSSIYNCERKSLLSLIVLFSPTRNCQLELLHQIIRISRGYS